MSVTDPSTIAFCDFTPTLVTEGSARSQPQLESVTSAVDAANQWIASTGVTVLNVETLILPLASRQLTTDNGRISEFSDGLFNRFQAVRVWYRGAHRVL